MRSPDRVTRRVVTAAFAISGVFSIPTAGFAEDEDALGGLIPQQVTSISREEIDQLPVLDVRNLTDYAPSLISDMGPANGSNRLTIRGLVPTRFQENVGVYMDGIDISSQGIGLPYGSMLSNPYFFDVESVEVKKGPHSAMYGRNAAAGAVLITTKDPGDEFGGNINVGGGDYGRALVQAGLSGPLTDNLGLGLNGAYQTSDGFYDNSITGNEIGGGDVWGLGGTLKWQATESFSVRARIAYSEEDLDQPSQAYVTASTSVDAPASALTTPGTASSSPVRCEPVYDDVGGTNSKYCDSPTLLVTGDIPDADQLQIRLSPNALAGGGDLPGSELEVMRGSLLLDWTLGAGTITSRTGYTDADTQTFNDRDKFAIQATPGDGIDLSSIIQILDTDTSTEQFSQELSFASAFDGPVQFTIGGLYWNEEVDQNDQNHFAVAAGNLCVLPDASTGGPFMNCNVGDHSTTVSQYVASQPGVHAEKPVNNIKRETDHWSAFGSLQFDMSEDVLLTLDLRYIDEEVTLTGPNTLVGSGQQDAYLSGPDIVSICGVGSCTPFDPLPLPDGNGGTDFSDPATFTPIPTAQATFTKDDDYWAPAASLVWSTTDSSSIYVSFSQGRTPGGLTMTPLRTVGFGIDPDHNGSPSEIEFNSEKITSFEFGGSASTVNDTLHFDVGLFVQRINNRQVVTQSLTLDLGDPTDPTDDENLLVDSIAGQADVDVAGIELGIRWQPNHHWNIAAEYTYLNAEYDTFSVLSDNADQVAAAGNCRAMDVGGLPTCGVDFAGNEVAGVPENAFFGEISYIAPLADTGIDWFIAANGRFQSARFINASNSASVTDYWISDLRLGVTTDRWDVVFYVDNVFDNEIVQYAYQQADTANYEARIGVCTFEVPPFTVCNPVQPNPQPANLTTPNYPMATIANQPDPQRWGIRAGFRF